MEKHETIGCEQMYTDFQRQGVTIALHAHDRNLSVNKVIKAKDGVQNCNERWHATKPVTQGIKKISSGARRTKDGHGIRNYLTKAIVYEITCTTR